MAKSSEVHLCLGSAVFYCAISSGSLLRAEKEHPKLWFLRDFTCFGPRSPTDLGSLFSEYLRPFGESLLFSRDIARSFTVLLLSEENKQIFLFSRGIVRLFYGVATFGENNQVLMFSRVFVRSFYGVATFGEK